MEYSGPSAGTHEISAEYVLPADGPEQQNYNEPAPVSCSFEVGKADEDQIQIKEVGGKALRRGSIRTGTYRTEGNRSCEILRS